VIHGSPVIHFPATEIADLKAQLASGRTVSSVHEKGKHKAGDIVMSSLGMLRVLNVKPVAPHELTAHSGAVKARVAGGNGDMLELKKLGEFSPGPYGWDGKPNKNWAKDLDEMLANGQISQDYYDRHYPAKTACVHETEAPVTDTPALDLLATKKAGLADFGRNALMAGAIGSAGVAGGMGGQALGHAAGMHLDHSNPNPPMSAPARVQERAETHPANTLGTIGGIGGAGGGAAATALALLAARRRGVPVGARPVG